MKKSELKEIIKSAMLEEAEDSKKGNKEEQKRMEGSIRDDRDHIKNLEKDIKDNEDKLAKLKKDFKKDIIKEYDSDIENQTGEDFGFWFRAGVKAEKQIQQAKDLLTQNGIEFNAEGRFGIDFQGKGYEKREIVQLLRDNGLTLFVIYDHEKEDTINEELVDFEGNDMYPEIKGDMKRYYKMDVPMNVIKDWANDYFSDRYDDKDDYEFETSAREDFLDHLEDEFASGDSKPEWWNLTEAKEVDVEDNEEVDVDIEKDVKIDDESVESDIEVDASMPGEDADEIAVQSLLMKAQEEAAKLGDEKLTDQIGNTITYFTRAHVSQVDETENYNSDDVDISTDNPAEDAEIGFALQEVKRFKKLAGIIK